MASRSQQPHDVDPASIKVIREGCTSIRLGEERLLKRSGLGSRHEVRDRFGPRPPDAPYSRSSVRRRGVAWWPSARVRGLRYSERDSSRRPGQLPRRHNLVDDAPIAGGECIEPPPRKGEFGSSVMTNGVGEEMWCPRRD